MKKNNAGGYSFAVSNWSQLERFVILGTEGGTYYVSENKLTVENAKNVIECIKENGIRVIDLVAEISDMGRAPKNDPALFVMALCMSPEYADLETRRYGVQKLPEVARIGTHILTFADMLQNFRGWGKLSRKSIANWFENQKASSLAYQAIKYVQRNGWALKDLLRLSHAVAKTSDQSAVFQYIAHPEDITEEGKIDISRRISVKTKTGWEHSRNNKILIDVPDVIYGTYKVKNAKTINEVVDLITQYNLPREVIPTEFLNNVNVWNALLAKMPITALIRNINKMTSIGLLKPLGKETNDVVNKLVNDELLKKARVHPISLLLALRTYDRGAGIRGGLSWKPVQEITSALEEAFYKSFNYVENSNKRFYLGLDVSGSMTCPAPGTNGILSCRDVSAVMAMTTIRTEPRTFTYGFCHKLLDLKINKTNSINQVIRKISKLPFGGTDCALPMIHALQEKIEVDTFVVYTDNETWAGRNHPVQELYKYRKEMGIPAKLIVVSIVPNKFSIADPLDPGMLDIVGFDTNTPGVITEFSK